ncbi:MAG: protein-L-isoaspartate O-methyltransferase [Pirellulales bacterium]
MKSNRICNRFSSRRFAVTFSVAVMLILPITVRLQAQTPDTEKYAMARARLVEEVLKTGGITNERVLQAVGSVPRHEFVNPEHRKEAYYDKALPIGASQTISSPYIVSVMTQELDPKPTETVLEIGTGSGYQAAVLSPLVKEVYSIEIVKDLGESAAKLLARLGYSNVHVKPKSATDSKAGKNTPVRQDHRYMQSGERVPQPLIDQLKDGGLMIIPVGERYQQTPMRMRKKGKELEREALVPLCSYR